MREPYRSQFAALIRGGAASQDVHDAGGDAGYASARGVADDAFVRRELERVETHQRSLVPLLEPTVGRARRILDFGCGTGGTTVALALSPALAAEEVIGVDANPVAVRAATVRAAGHDLAPPRVRFAHVEPGAPLPGGGFDLVVTVSVMEFITDPDAREQVVAALKDAVRPGGYLFVATPRPALREYHSKRYLGDLRRGDGMPWSSPPWQLARWARGWETVRLPVPPRAAALARRAPGLLQPVLERAMRAALPLAGQWQRMLIRRPAG
jgi:SAM-dependent methyltransferase